MQALLRGRPGREGGHCRSLFRFPQHCLGSKRPLGANKASPQPAAVQPPSAQPWGQAHQASGLLKWQVQGGNEVMSKLGLVGGRTRARAGQAGEETDGHWGLSAPGSAQHWAQQQGFESLDGMYVSGTEGTTKKPKKEKRENSQHKVNLGSPCRPHPCRAVPILAERPPRSRIFLLICKPRGGVRVCTHLSLYPHFKCVHMCTMYMWAQVRACICVCVHACVCEHMCAC